MIAIKKSGEDFKTQALSKGIERWDIHDCSFCGYMCGFVFNSNEVYYDSGCDCTGGGGWDFRNWEDVADFYNIQSNADVIKRFNNFWGFEE